MTSAPNPFEGLTPRAREIVETARQMLERDGWEQISMRDLAQELGIRAPSLYKHFAHREALKSALVSLALVESGTALRPVGTVADLLAAYRAVAVAHPHLYRLATAGPLDRAALPEGVEEWSGAPFFEATGDPFVAQALWAAAHGLVILEIEGRLPTASAPERTWDALAEQFG